MPKKKVHRRAASTTRDTARSSEVATDGFFVAIGHEPNSELFEGQLDLDEKGYIVIASRAARRRTIPGVFACGDVQDKSTARR